MVQQCCQLLRLSDWPKQHSHIECDDGGQTDCAARLDNVVDFVETSRPLLSMHVVVLKNTILVGFGLLQATAAQGT